MLPNQRRSYSNAENATPLNQTQTKLEAFLEVSHALKHRKEMPEYSIIASKDLTSRFKDLLGLFPLYFNLEIKNFGFHLLWKKKELPMYLSLRECRKEKKEEYFSDFGALDSLDVSEMLKIASPSPFGMGSQTLYDTNVRSANEIKADSLFLMATENKDRSWRDEPGEIYELDRLIPYNIVHQISKNLSEFIPGKVEPVIKWTKLNIYGPGDFFKVHKDTPHSTNHIGSLVIVLPLKYTGGEFVVYDNFGKEHVVENGKSVGIYTDVDHEVRKVVSGYRVTITADLEYKEDDKNMFLQNNEKIRNVMNERSSYSSDLMKNLCEESLNLVKDEKEFSVLLYHQYLKGLRKEYLKGIDKEILAYFEKEGFSSKLVPIVVLKTIRYDKKWSAHELPTSVMDLNEETGEENQVIQEESEEETDKSKEEDEENEEDEEKEEERKVMKPLIVFTMPPGKLMRKDDTEKYVGNDHVQIRSLYYYNTVLNLKKPTHKST